MYIHTNSTNLIKLIPIFFCVLIAIFIIFLILYLYIKNQDEKKELVTKKVKILEKPIQQGNIEWYIVECENSERLKLRSFQADNIIITVGDTGIISYKGKTIQSFQRNN